MTNQSVIELNHVTHRYGAVCALNDVSLRIERGATVGLIGPDGVGKSTLLAIMAGVRAAQTGEIRVLDCDVFQAAQRQKLAHDIAYMPQGLGKNLYPTLSVYENIEFHARLFGLNAAEREQRITRLLAATGLSPFLARKAHQLSGGMKQKLSLCCALVHNPKLLILDEPTTGVDPLSRRQFWDLLNALRRENRDMTVLVATAYIDEAQQFQQLIAMYAGKILTHESTQNVLQKYGVQNLEDAYIKLLPPELQQGAGYEPIAPFFRLPETPPVMQANDLVKRFGDFVAVDKVSFTIEKGEIFGFLGANGCGKSTTMKMLTGLLAPTSGSAQLLGESIDAGSLNSKKRVGYMSQAFSLYEELTVRQNLDLHAKLYEIANPQHTINQALQEFDLQEYAEMPPAQLPLGIRQRLQLAAACLHEPEILILDEPTSGVDPAARDMFWRKLGKLSREKRMTIFVSTHFMNEVGRCDRISLMNRGKVLAMGTPAEVVAQSGQANTEEAFIYYLQQDNPENSVSGSLKTPLPPPQMIVREDWRKFDQNPQTNPRKNKKNIFINWLNVVYTFAFRESKELLRDKIRLFFAAIGPAILLASLGWAISFDVNHVRVHISDRDQSAQSRELIEQFSGSRYFTILPTAPSQNAETLFQNNVADLIVDIPPNFGRDLVQFRQPEIGAWIDGTAPFNGNNLTAYLQAIQHEYNQNILKKQGIEFQAAAQIVPRFWYNPNFRSVNSIVPSVMMLVLMMIPAIMSALSVVRERELGSIQNLYASPVSVAQYLLGKQMPYVAMGAVNFVLLWAMTVFWFGVPMTGSFGATFLGAMLLVCASTALGLLISSFTRSQTTAFFISALGTMVPAVNFSGLIYPVASMKKGAYLIGISFPASWFGLINKGGFSKGLGWANFYREYLILFGFFILYFALACLFLKKQEK